MAGSGQYPYRCFNNNAVTARTDFDVVVTDNLTLIESSYCGVVVVGLVVSAHRAPQTNPVIVLKRKFELLQLSMLNTAILNKAREGSGNLYHTQISLSWT